MTTEPRFLRRFEQIRASLRRYQESIGLAATVLAAAVGLALLAWADYERELPRTARAVGLAVASLATLVVLARWLVVPLRWWTQPRTASEIEVRFPQLGQRIRTVVQYGGRPDAQVAEQGVKPSLVVALEAETEAQAEPLPLDRVVRWRRAQALTALAAVPVAFLAIAATADREWRTAIARALLVEVPYTTVEVSPGDVLVDQDKDVPIAVEIKGRPRPSLALLTRPAGKTETDWTSEVIGGTGPKREAKVAKVHDPIEYRVVAGPAGSPPYAIRIRYPLALKTFEVTVTPPAYTGLDAKTTKGGDVQAVEGSAATFRLAFDAAPSEASLELVDPSKKVAKPGQPAEAPTILRLKADGDALVAAIDLTKDLEYKVIARTDDGRKLAETKYRIDVREDRAPRVSFDEPDEALEVHPIAEVLHRARVADDFGLARAGIVFRFNDGEEKTLVLKDFPATKGQKPKTSATLEDVLRLESLGATPLDSVTYYAFAEDNYPAGARRTETDLRYIDLRVFKREYKLAEPGSGDGDPAELIALEELIARQRVNLNRGTRLARQKPTDRVQAEDPLKVAGFEESLLNLTKEFTAGIEALADAKVDSLHKAIDAMQASIDALDRSRNAEVPPAMAEALKNLVAARRDLLFLIGEDSAKAAAMRAFDRKQAQKIRKPKSKDEEAEEVADRLEELAQDEDFVYATIAMGEGGTEPNETKADAKGQAGTPEKTEPKDGEPKEPARAEPKKSPQGQPEGAADKPGETEKGGTTKAKGGEGNAKGEGEGDQTEGAGEPKKLDRRSLAEKQEEIADELRDIEEKLKRFEAISDLAKARMAKAAEKAEKTSGTLARGNAKEAADEAKAAGGMLHELARQVKGEVAKEAADGLAMARDLAEELAKREAEFAKQAEGQAGPGKPGETPDKDGEKEGKGEGSKPGKDGEKDGKGRGNKPGKGGLGAGGWDGLTDGEKIDRMAEMARTLEGWLKQIERGEGKAADAVGEILEQGNIAEVVERAERMGEVRLGGRPEELAKAAREQATKLEVVGEALELIHRGIVAPQLAAMVEFDRRVAALTAKLANLKTEAEVAAWRRDVAALVRDLEKAGVDGAAELADALRTGGAWHWDGGHNHMVGPETVTASLKAVSVQIKDRVQEMILKDLASGRDEAAPPMYRELVDRYYEVLSRGARAK